MNNILHRLPPNVLVDSPGTEDMSLLEDLFNFLKTAPNSLRVHKEHMNERRKVKGTEDEVRLPCNSVEARWDGIGKGEVEEPIACLIESVLSSVPR